MKITNIIAVRGPRDAADSRRCIRSKSAERGREAKRKSWGEPWPGLPRSLRVSSPEIKKGLINPDPRIPTRNLCLLRCCSLRLR
jgi:hypothetical protein